ncbi:LemA family protein [Candidatus Woesearchaeota archaeon]|nr:LemA family protein [Candidatus Woesearchaeota archaeon]
MKKNYGLWITLGVIALLILFLIGSYNGLVGKRNAAQAAWADVETQYQRRMDLVPNLVSTVKGYAAHEEELFTKITELRSQWQSASAAGDTQGAIAAAQGTDSALARLLVVAENYPDLKASTNFLALQDELAGTENRVAVARTRYNDAVKAYNTAIQTFPRNILAGLFGFKPEAFFQAASGAETVPSVSFE